MRYDLRFLFQRHELRYAINKLVSYARASSRERPKGPRLYGRIELHEDAAVQRRDKPIPVPDAPLAC